ncbi:MAG: sulfatase-like hydrolase/transferase [Flavobacteriaceae bacterium]
MSIFIIQWKFKQENFLFAITKSFKEYKETKELLKNNLAKPESDYLTNVIGLSEPQTYVVVVGESTSSWHMQLYGYGRKTNPQLTEIRKELFVFKDVITPNVHTITAIEKILTLSDAKNVNKKNNGSVIQLANQAGFKTYWISNQKPVGYYESIPTLIGSAATSKQFIATDNYNYDIYDESLLPYIEKALDEKQSKKVIFIQLIGTHVSYHKRYPEKYNVFKDEFIDPKFKNKNSIKFVNTYDNAVLYNDYIVRSIIEKVRKKDINSYVLYFSDHGDEVFDTMDFIGHNEYHGTKPMYEVPFVLWVSDKYKKNNPSFLNINSMLDRRYSLENFIHSFSDLSLIKFDSLNLSKSVFNSNFIYQPRIIKKNQNYDSD